VTSKAKAISKRTAHQAGLAAGGRARPVAIPGPDEYEGDDEVKPHVHHVHKIATNLHEQFNLHVHSSTGSVLAGDSALRVGGRTRDVR
jgi:hypothetical protein